ncbi:siderophore-interacting protein [Sphingobacterium sp. LRF_L2]|uniref:siderophore-interacting protein n=1 Tax=Sphingobacterium sp. LRF_L2 TaxID=3369421 RepID=UPI003F5F7AAF
MPRVPKWMADAMQSLFSGMYHPAQITAVEDLAGQLRKIRFEGDFSKSKKQFVPGNVIEFRISDTEFRHYTPSYFDQHDGVCEVLFFLHDKGPGSRWVANLKTGDTLNLLGPGGKIKYNSEFKTHIAFGDETSLGLLMCLRDEAIKQQHQFIGLAEMHAENKNWLDILELNIAAVEKKEELKKADTIDKLKELIENQNTAKSDMVFYLTGNAKSILGLKKFLLENGLTNKQIQTEPYWVEGKQGL